MQGSTKEFTRAHDWLFSEEEMNRIYPLHTKTHAKYYLFTLHCSLTATDREVWGQRYAFGPQIPPAASPHSLPGLRAPKLPSLAPHLSSGLLQSLRTPLPWISSQYCTYSVSELKPCFAHTVASVPQTGPGPCKHREKYLLNE